MRLRHCLPRCSALVAWRLSGGAAVATPTPTIAVHAAAHSSNCRAVALQASRRVYCHLTPACRQQQQHGSGGGVVAAAAAAANATQAALRAGEYACGECGKSFRLLNALHHHIQTKHAGQATAMRRVDGKLVAVTDSSSSGGGATTTATTAASTAQHVSFASVLSPFPMNAAAAAAAAPQPAATAATASVRSDEADDNNSSTTTTAAAAAADEQPRTHFVCSICAKQFRIEAALQHHYQAKHGMEMPTTSSATSAAHGALRAGDDGSASPEAAAGGDAHSSTASDASGSAAYSNSNSNSASASEAVLSSAYVRQPPDASALPHAVQYHTAVAPNAPDESDVAAHWCCVNRCVLLGSVADVQTGYVFEDKVLQFSLVTAFVAPAVGEPDKDVHTVRVYDEQHWQPLLAALRDGVRCVVTGRLRLVPQYEATLRRYLLFPVVQVMPGSGGVMLV